MTSRLVLLGYFHRGNLGDDAMLDGLRAFLTREGAGDREVRALPLPAFTPRAVRPAIELVRALRWADAVILAGGSHFHDGYGRRSVRILLTLWLVFRVARWLGADVGFAGVGVGPAETRAGRRLIRRSLDEASVVLVRDAASARTVQGLGTRTTTMLGFDAASLLSPAPRPARPAAPRVGLSLVPFHRVWRDAPAQDEATVAAVADVLADVGAKAGVVADVLVLNKCGRIEDGMVSDALARRLESRLETEVDLCSTPAATLSRLAGLSGLVATRYHAALLGYLSELPMLVVAYEDKCRALAEEIGLPAAAVLEPDDLLDRERLHTALRSLVADPDTCRATVPVGELVARARAGFVAFERALGLGAAA